MAINPAQLVLTTQAFASLSEITLSSFNILKVQSQVTFPVPHSHLVWQPARLIGYQGSPATSLCLKQQNVFFTVNLESITSPEYLQMEDDLNGRQPKGKRISGEEHLYGKVS